MEDLFDVVTNLKNTHKCHGCKQMCMKERRKEIMNLNMNKT